MTRDEKEFVKAVVDHDAKVLKLIDDIKEKFNINSIYDSDENLIEIKIDENVDGADAINVKKWIHENLDNVGVVFDFEK
jgi:hypothetical protein